MATNNKEKITELANDAMQVIKFSKERLMKSKRYADKIDFLFAYLEDDKEYSIKEVDEIMDKVMKGEMK